jgi:RimJ/RimL family protein N-acetyltransferase
MARRQDERMTPRLLLVPWTDQFRTEWARILADPNVVRFISDGVPYSHEEAAKNAERGERLWKEHGFGPWAAIDRATGRWVGRLGLNLLEDWPGPDRWEVGWELDQPISLLVKHFTKACCPCPPQEPRARVPVDMIEPRHHPGPTESWHPAR